MGYEAFDSDQILDQNYIGSGARRQSSAVRPLLNFYLSFLHSVRGQVCFLIFTFCILTDVLQSITLQDLADRTKNKKNLGYQI